MVKCLSCGEELDWESDTLYENYGLEGKGLVITFSCPKDKCSIEHIIVHQRWNKEEHING